jgi:hypothetical protein
MKQQSPFKWRHARSRDHCVVCALVPARCAQLARPGGDDGSARAARRSHHDLSLGEAALLRNSKNAAECMEKPALIAAKSTRRPSQSKNHGWTSPGLSLQKGTRLAFLLSPTQDAEAAKRFFCQALPSTGCSAAKIWPKMFPLLTLV